MKVLEAKISSDFTFATHLIGLMQWSLYGMGKEALEKTLRENLGLEAPPRQETDNLHNAFHNNYNNFKSEWKWLGKVYIYGWGTTNTFPKFFKGQALTKQPKQSRGKGVRIVLPSGRFLYSQLKEDGST